MVLNLFLAFMFLISSWSFASEVILKNGQKLEGTITEQTGKYIKFDAGIGMAVTYFMDEIDSIDGQTVQLPPPPPPVHVFQPAEEKQADPVPTTVMPAQTPPAAVPDLNSQQKNPAADVPQGAVIDDNQNAQGQLQGRPFTVSQAKFDTHMGILDLRQGEGFFPDLEIQLFLFKPQGPSWENNQLHIAPESSGLKPQIYKKWKDEGSDIPKQKVYLAGYNLDLSLGEIHDGKIHGTIHLRLPDEQGSHVEGSFDALVDSKIQVNQGSLSITEKRNLNKFNVNQFHKNEGAFTFTGNSMNRAFSGKAAFMSGVGGFILSIMFIVFIVLFLFSALCLQFISQKTKKGEPWMAWIPIANCFLMCKIADVPYVWLWLMFAGVIPILGMLIVLGLSGYIWYRIALVLNKPGWWGILALVPGVNFIAIGYLAFAE